MIMQTVTLRKGFEFVTLQISSEPGIDPESPEDVREELLKYVPATVFYVSASSRDRTSKGWRVNDTKTYSDADEQAARDRANRWFSAFVGRGYQRVA